MSVVLPDGLLYKGRKDGGVKWGGEREGGEEKWGNGGGAVWQA